MRPRSCEAVSKRTLTFRFAIVICAAAIASLGAPASTAAQSSADRALQARVEAALNEKKSPTTGHRYLGINAGIGNLNTFYEVELFESFQCAVDRH